MRRIAIVGIGRWGKNLIREFSKLAQIKTCVTTGNQKNLKWLQQNYPSVAHTTNVHQILKDPDIDAIVIATPISSHFTLVKKALEYKKHVFVEKPLTKTVTDADEKKLLFFSSYINCVKNGISMNAPNIIRSTPIAKKTVL